MLLVLELSATVGTVEEEGLTVFTPVVSHFILRPELLPSLPGTLHLHSTGLHLAFFAVFHTAWVKADLIRSWFTFLGIVIGSTSVPHLASFIRAFRARLTVSSLGRRRQFPTALHLLNPLSLLISA